MVVAQVRRVVRCPRCAGPMYSAYHDRSCAEYGCLLCGEYLFAPAERRWVRAEGASAGARTPSLAAAIGEAERRQWGLVGYSPERIEPRAAGRTR